MPRFAPWGKGLHGFGRASELINPSDACFDEGDPDTWDVSSENPSARPLSGEAHLIVVPQNLRKRKFCQRELDDLDIDHRHQYQIGHPTAFGHWTQ